MFILEYLSIIIQFFLLILLLLLSALFSSTETALTTLHPIDVKMLVHEKAKNAEFIVKLKEDMHLTIAAILLGNNLVNIAASAIATLLTIHLFGNQLVGLTIGFLTFFILVFGEIAPKNYATKNAKKLSIKMARPIYLIRTILSPLLKVLLRLSERMLPLNEEKNEEFEFNEETISKITEIGESEGLIEEDEKEFIQRLFKFSDKRVKDVMVPLDEMVYINFYSKVSHAKNVAIASGHSRIPVYKSDVGKFVGILYVKDLLRVSDRKYIYTIMRPALFVDKDTYIDTQLRRFLKEHIHMALVLDRDQKTGKKKVIGLVTLEDIIEELIGEIIDEHDIEELKEIKEKKLARELNLPEKAKAVESSKDNI